jgi:hypothetical protein
MRARLVSDRGTEGGNGLAGMGQPKKECGGRGERSAGRWGNKGRAGPLGSEGGRREKEFFFFQFDFSKLNFKRFLNSFEF